MQKIMLVCSIAIFIFLMMAWVWLAGPLFEDFGALSPEMRLVTYLGSIIVGMLFVIWLIIVSMWEMVVCMHEGVHPKSSKDEPVKS